MSDPRRAIVWLRSGRSYEGLAELSGPWLNFTGRRRVREDDQVHYCGDTGDRTWPSREIREVLWLEEREAA